MSGGMWLEALIVSTLLWLALQDIRHLGISRAGLAVASGILLIAGFCREVGWQSRMGGLAIGLLLLVFGYFSKEAVGIADGIVVSVCGVAFGVYETTTLSFFAAVYTALFALILLLIRKAGKKSRIPFLPFVLLGYITMRLLVETI